MTPLLIESFELYNPVSEQTFAEHLLQCGYTVTGTPEMTLDRSGYAQAADLSLGGFTLSTPSLEPVVTFGFAARYTTPGVALHIHDDLVLRLDEAPEINGLDADATVAPGRWAFYEVRIRKQESRVDLFVNDESVLTIPMPNSLRFLTNYRPSLKALPGLIVDDVTVVESGRIGPVAARAYETNAPVPWSSSTAGNSAAGTLRQTSSGDNDIALVSVRALVSVSDLDDREVAVTAAANTAPVPLSIAPRYRQGLFTERGAGTAWTDDNINTAAFGVRITE